MESVLSNIRERPENVTFILICSILSVCALATVAKTLISVLRVRSSSYGTTEAKLFPKVGMVMASDRVGGGPVACSLNTEIGFQLDDSTDKLSWQFVDVPQAFPGAMPQYPHSYAENPSMSNPRVIRRQKMSTFTHPYQYKQANMSARTQQPLPVQICSPSVSPKFTEYDHQEMFHPDFWSLNAAAPQSEFPVLDLSLLPEEFNNEAPVQPPYEVFHEHAHGDVVDLRMPDSRAVKHEVPPPEFAPDLSTSERYTKEYLYNEYPSPVFNSSPSSIKSPHSVQEQEPAALEQPVARAQQQPEKSERSSRSNSQASSPQGNQLQFSCPDCGAEFRIKGYLTRHMKKHAVDKAYTCPFYNPQAEHPCHTTGGFSRRDTYKTHLKARHFVYPPHTPLVERPNVSGCCGGCYKEFDSNEEWIETHIQKKACPFLHSE